jgi:hypothetical protein
MGQHTLNVTHQLLVTYLTHDPLTHRLLWRSVLNYAVLYYAVASSLQSIVSIV